MDTDDVWPRKECIVLSRLSLRALSLFLLVIVLLTGCSRGAATTQILVPPTPPDPPATVPPQPAGPQGRSPLTGLSAPQSALAGRPVAVMIDNAPTARPHYGLSSADLLYEMLVEGGLTRIMAVFHSRQSDVIGPVRSVRPAFVEKAMELSATLVHCGGSEEALQSIPELGVPDIDEIPWPAPFWRDRLRSAPHDLFTSSANLKQAMASRASFAGSLEHSVLAFDDAALAGKSATELTIRYPGGYVVGYRYDSEAKVYQRLMNGQAHTDAGNGQALTASNLVIPVVSVKVLDSEGRLRFASVGKGEAYVITQGVVRKGQWVKDSAQALMRLVDAEGNEMTVVPGVTWIQQVTPQTPLEIR